MDEPESRTPPADAREPRENAVDLVDESDADDRVAEVFAEIRAAREGDLDDDLRVSKLWRLLANDPALAEIVRRHMDHVYNGGELPFELKSEISLVVASVLECEGCRFFHESALSHAGVDAERIDGLSRLEIDGAGFTPSEELVLRFAQTAAEDPHAVTDDDLAALRDLGFSERELVEIIDCIALHVYTAVLQGAAGIVHPGMSRSEWTGDA